MSDPLSSSETLPPARPRGKRLVVQVVGILLSVALLAWCVSIAFGPQNRERLMQLRQAPVGTVVTLFALSAASLLLTGASFWLTLWPARRLPLARVEAVNAVASFLGYLPFKLSLISRVVLHHRRDGLPLLTAGAWLVAQAVLALGVILPLAAAGIWRGRIDGVYAVAALLLLGISYGAIVTIARWQSGPAGLSRLQRWGGRLGFVGRLLRSPNFAKVHAGFDMLAHPASVAAAMSVRALDIGAQAGRFVVAAQALNVPLSWDAALLSASTFFLLGVLSPAGAVGSREGGTTGLAALLSLPGAPAETIAVVSVLVSASEIIVYTLAALCATLVLRRPSTNLTVSSPSRHL